MFLLLQVLLLRLMLYLKRCSLVDAVFIFHFIVVVSANRFLASFSTVSTRSDLPPVKLRYENSSPRSPLPCRSCPESFPARRSPRFSVEFFSETKKTPEKELRAARRQSKTNRRNAGDPRTGGNYAEKQRQRVRSSSFTAKSRSSFLASFLLLAVVVLVDADRDDGLVAGRALAQLRQRAVVVDVADRRQLVALRRRRVLGVLERRRQRLLAVHRRRRGDERVLLLAPHRLDGTRVSTHARLADVERDDGALARHRRRQQRVVATAAAAAVSRRGVAAGDDAVRRSAAPVHLAAGQRRTELRIATAVRHVGVPLRLARTDHTHSSHDSSLSRGRADRPLWHSHTTSRPRIVHTMTLITICSSEHSKPIN